MPQRDPSHWDFVSEEAYPNEFFPTWASGEGYLLSRTFNECAVRMLENTSFIPMEGVATGILAELCNVQCQSDEWESWKDPSDLVIVSHPLEPKYMMTLDWSEDFKEKRN